MLAEDNLGPSSHNREKHKGNKKLCNFFNSKTGCRFGDKCRFKHEVLNQARVVTPVEVKEGVDKKSIDVEQHEELNQPRRATGTSLAAEPAEDLEVKSACYTEESEVKEEGIGEPNVKIKPQVCSHFIRQGWCRFGKRCRFSHPKRDRRRGYPQNPQSNKKEKLNDVDLHAKDDDGEKLNREGTGRVSSQDPNTRRRLCRFYLKRNCYYGDTCKYQHDDNSSEKSEENVQPKQHEQQSSFPDQRGKRISNLAKGRIDLTTDDIVSLRKTECEQLKKRFPKGKLQILSESEEDCSYKVEFVPTDPDWPFDIKVFSLQIGIPDRYPLNMFSVELPDDDILPSAVRRYVERRSTEWLDEKEAALVEADKVELVFRPFLRWLDRNLEDIVTEGLRRYQRELTAKAAGFEFIPAKDVSVRKQEEEDAEGEYRHPCERQEDSEEVTDSEEEAEASSDEEESRKARSSCADVERKGTEILLRNLQLKENAATLLFQKLAIIIQCGRCKSTTEFSTPAGRLNSIQCAKCCNEQRVVFRAAMAHHFSAVIGYLDLADCQPYDLILQDCLGTVSCLNCSKEMKCEGLVPGQVKQSWCQRCHKKLTVAAESVRFQQLQPSDLNDQSKVHQIQVNKPRRVLRDPAIQEGKPLPAEGTCKHYKKSFRWLRFPCCGKCYPCDICHDDKEGDHEMKFASRMICGFCCKEQPYTVEKPCVLCGSQLTKVHSTHWEGGRGCRDKIRMSRNDGQKYSSMNKTVSKKAQDKLEAKKTGSKTTKLRHV